MYKVIDLEDWERKDHFQFFKDYESPQFSITANLNITETLRYREKHNLPFFLTVLYCTLRSINEIEEFRTRCKKNKIILYEQVGVGFTYQFEKQKLYSNCIAEYFEDFRTFIEETTNVINKEKVNPTLKTENKRDDLIYTSCLPWLSFTSFTNPYKNKSDDFIPRVVWGKCFEENDNIKIPISLQVHHAIVDGHHASEFYKKLQGFFDNPYVFDSY